MINHQEQGQSVTSSNEMIPIPLDAEKIEVGGFVSEIVDFYHLSPEVAKKGVTTQAYIVSGEQLAKITLDRAREFYQSNPDIEPEPDWEDNTTKNVLDFGGLFIPFTADQSFILLNRDIPMNKNELGIRRSVRHELMHAMSSHTPETGLGFKQEDGRGFRLNEATAELLELHQRLYASYKEELSKFQHIESGAEEKQSPYADHLRRLGFLIRMTELSGKPFTIQDLTNIFFDHTSSPITRIEKLRAEFENRCPKMRTSVNKVFDVLLMPSWE